MPLPSFDDFLANTLDPQKEVPNVLSLETFLEFITVNPNLHTLIKSKFPIDQGGQVLLSIQTCALLVFQPLLPLWNSERPVISFQQLLNISQPAATILLDEKLSYLFTGENPLFTIDEILNISDSASNALKNEAIRTMLTQKSPLLSPQQILRITPKAQRHLSTEVIRECATRSEPLFSLQDILTERYPLDALEIKEIYELFLSQKFTLHELSQITDAALLALKDDEIRISLLQDPELDLVKDLFSMTLNAYRCLKNAEILALTQKPCLKFSLMELLGVSDLGLAALTKPHFRALIEGPEPQIAPHYLLNIKIRPLQLLENPQTRGLFLGEHPCFTQEELFTKINNVSYEALCDKDIRELLALEPPKITPERILKLEADNLIAIRRNLDKVKDGTCSLDRIDEQVKKAKPVLQFPIFVAPKPQGMLEEDINYDLEFKRT